MQSVLNIAYTEYKKAKGKELTEKDLFGEIDSVIEKIKAMTSFAEDLSDFLVDFFEKLKFGLQGANIYFSDEYLEKTLDLIKKAMTLSNTPKKEIAVFNFWADLIMAIIDIRKKENRPGWQ